jgi:ABC-2 type transport system ATP-binding protein
MQPPTAIHVVNVHKHIKAGRRKVVNAVDGISLDIMEGEVFGILGPNGAGKTTLFRLMAGLLRPTEGTVVTLGHDPWQDHAQVHQQIGYLTENHGNYEELTVLQNLQFFGEIYRVPDLEDRIEKIISRLSLDEKTHEKVAKLSKGLKQRLALARSFLHDPPLLFLDEPTASLDPAATRAIHNMIVELKARRRTIVIASHKIDEIQKLCDRVAIIDGGKIIRAGTAKELDASIWSGQVLEVTLVPPVPTGILEALRQLSIVKGADIDLSHLKIHVSDAHDAAPAITKFLVESQCNVLEIQPSRHSLEDVYLKLVDSAEAYSELEGVEDEMEGIT